MSSASPIAPGGATTARRLRLLWWTSEPAVQIGLIAGATVLWLAAVAGTDLDAMAGLGLLNALPVTFFAAFGLLLAGFARGVTRPSPQPFLLGLNLAAVTTLLHGTTSLLYDVPRYVWSYKHIGVTELLEGRGSLDRSLDVYNNWPGFFGLEAWLSGATGIAVDDLAAWAPLFFALTGLVALHFALRAVTADPRVIWTACWLFVLTNWIGQNYFAPQAIAVVLSLVMVGLVLRCPVPAAAPRTAPARRLARLQNRLQDPRTGAGGVPDAGTPTSRAWLLALAGLCFAALVVTHQLSPFLVLVQVGALALFCRQVPLWFIGVLVALEAAWVATALPYLENRFDLFDFSAAPTPQTGLDTSHGLPGVTVVNASKPLLMAAIAILGVAGAVATRRARRLPPAVSVLAAAPLAVVAVQQYGGEGPLRVYLFALPWLCLLAADLLVATRRPARPATRSVAVLALGAALGTLFLLAHFGPEQKNYLTRDDVAIATWFERETPAGSLLTPVVLAHPVYLTASYPDYIVRGEMGTSLAEMPEFQGHRLGAADVPRLRALFSAGADDRSKYLLVTGIQIRLAELYQAVPDGSFASLRAALAAQPDFRLAYAAGDGYVFEYLPSRPAA